MEWTYEYSETIPHAVQTVDDGQATVGSYQYDENGNMICRIEDGVTYKHTYNTENRISSIVKVDGDCTTFTVIESWSYLYDGDGIRVQEDYFVETTLTSTKKYYFGGMYETHSDNTIIKYYSFNGQTIAMDDGDGLKYFLTDHLGSTVAIVDDEGTLIEQQRYLPFGGERTDISSPIVSTDFNYTGQRDLDGTGLMDYNFRFYSPVLGRFISPDNIVPDFTNPQTYNRYSYVYNRPIVLNDPTGHCPTCLAGFVIGAVVGATIYATTSVASGREFSWSDFGIAAATGAIGGTLVGTGLGATAGLAAFATIGAGGGLLAAQTGYSIASQENYRSEEMLVAAGVGAVSGAISGALGAPAPVNPLSGTTTALALNAGTNFLAGSAQYIGTQLVNGMPIDPSEAAISGGVSYIVGGITGLFSLNGGYTSRLVDMYGMSFIRRNMRIPFVKAVVADSVSSYTLSTSIEVVSNNMPAVRQFVASAPKILQKINQHLPY